MPIGPMMQSGFVVRDWRQAANHWIDALGVGPFFVLRHIEFAECFYRGEPTEPDLSVAIAYSGDHQIELVQQHNDAPSIYTAWLAENAPGLQHMGTLVEDVDATIEAQGWRDRVIQHGSTAAGQRFAYVDIGIHGGGMVELIEADGPMMDAFSAMREAAANWDGTRPIRG